MPFVRDPTHWLYRHSQDEWLRAALSELRRAEKAFSSGAIGAGIAGAKRAAGMALNAALLVRPEQRWGRSYVDHLAALREDPEVPQPVRDACALLLGTPAPNASGLVSLRGPRSTERVVDAARDVMAHAYAIVKKHEPLES